MARGHGRNNAVIGLECVSTLCNGLNVINMRGRTRLIRTTPDHRYIIYIHVHAFIDSTAQVSEWP